MMNSCRRTLLDLRQWSPRPGRYGASCLLGHDTFQAKAGGVLEHGGPVERQVLAEADRRRGRQSADDLLQQRLAVHQGRLGQIEPFAIQKIEQEIAIAITSVRAQVGLQQGEARDARGILDDDLAIEQRGTQPQRFQRRGDVGKPLGPIESFAREEPYVVAIDAGLRPVTVVLDLVHPLRAARRLVGRLRKARLKERRQDALARAAHAPWGRAAQPCAPRPPWRGRHGPCASLRARRAPRSCGRSGTRWSPLA